MSLPQFEPWSIQSVDSGSTRPLRLSILLYTVTYNNAVFME